MTFFGKNSHLSYMNLFYICIVKQENQVSQVSTMFHPKVENISRLIFCGIFLMMWVGVVDDIDPFFIDWLLFL